MKKIFSMEIEISQTNPKYFFYGIPGLSDEARCWAVLSISVLLSTRHLSYYCWASSEKQKKKRFGP
jgi:hypothetical protein